MTYSFFAYISRMRYITRWGLMRNTAPENVQEHSHMVAVLAHALASISRDIYKTDADPGRAASAALFHDAPEIFTGDMPTPVKYQNEEILKAYRDIEGGCCDRLLNMLPEEMKGTYSPLISQDIPEHKFVKAADTMSAYIKCIEEVKAGNSEFALAKKQTRKKLDDMGMQEVDYFMEKIMPAFELALDEL